MTNSENMREVTGKPVRLSLKFNEVKVKPVIDTSKTQWKLLS
jgi:hypothetical protein